MLPDLDVAITRGVNNASGQWPMIDHLMISISTIGIPFMVAAVAAQWWHGEDRRQTRHVVVAAGLSFLLGLALNQVVLLFVQRMRPYDAGVTHLLIERSADYSFPSDHATATFAIAATFLIHGMRRRGLLFLAAAMFMIASRVYVGAHYASDVLGGALTGVAASGLVRLTYQNGTRVDRFVTGIL